MHAKRCWVLVALVACGLNGCVARELAWLIPRATVGFIVTTNGAQHYEAGFITLVAPLQRPVRSQRAHSSGATSRIELLGPSTACHIPEVCRWEGRARSLTFAELAEEDELRIGGAP